VVDRPGGDDLSLSGYSPQGVKITLCRWRSALLPMAVSLRY
jgi:hypothetical protein